MPDYVCLKSRFPFDWQELPDIAAPDLDTALCIAGGSYGRDNVTSRLDLWHGQGGEKLYLVQIRHGSGTPTPGKRRRRKPDDAARDLF